jgi:tRNA 2-selenouridine synthase
MEFIDTVDFGRLFIDSYLLLDVRSEGEFEQSAIPGSLNIPLLNNEERKAVGITYKQSGQEEAIELGLNLVSGEVKSKRVERWKNALAADAPKALFCARGGLRSQVSQSWLGDAGLQVPRVRGGYKALRNYLIEQNQTLPDKFDFVIIGGSTGSGKTKFLNQLRGKVSTIDLEDLARHRGSAFGNVYGGQPRQATFENSLAMNLLRSVHSQARQIFIESESRRIGSSLLPESFWKRMSEGKIIVLELSLAERVENILEDYVHFVLKSLTIEQFGNYLISSVRRIEKHLGSELAKNLIKQMSLAIDEQGRSGSLAGHREWISTILTNYYDPHYEKHLKKNENRVILRARPGEVSSYIGKYYATA